MEVEGSLRKRGGYGQGSNMRRERIAHRRITRRLRGVLAAISLFLASPASIASAQEPSTVVFRAS
jgi:hypothetical protein